MQRLPIRLLVTVCSLVLVLPQGWCCIVPAPGTAQITKDCCCSCCRPTTPTPAQGRGGPTQLPKKTCPCAERVTIKSSTASDLDVGPATLAQAAPNARVPCLSGSARFADAGFLPPREQRHILHCVWRC